MFFNYFADSNSNFGPPELIQNYFFDSQHVCPSFLFLSGWFCAWVSSCVFVSLCLSVKFFVFAFVPTLTVQGDCPLKAISWPSFRRPPGALAAGALAVCTGAAADYRNHGPTAWIPRARPGYDRQTLRMTLETVLRRKVLHVNENRRRNGATTNNKVRKGSEGPAAILSAVGVRIVEILVSKWDKHWRSDANPSSRSFEGV